MHRSALRGCFLPPGTLRNGCRSRAYGAAAEIAVTPLTQGAQQYLPPKTWRVAACTSIPSVFLFFKSQLTGICHSHRVCWPALQEETASTPSPNDSFEVVVRKDIRAEGFGKQNKYAAANGAENLHCLNDILVWSYFALVPSCTKNGKQWYEMMILPSSS